METESSTSSDESVEMDHEAMMSEVPGATETLNKGQRRRILDAVQKVAESAQEEVRAQRQSRSKIPKRLPGPWRIIEVFTWSCMLSQCAFHHGWEAFEPITIEAGWNLSRAADQDRAMKYLESADPDVLMLAWPCGPWSILQNANQRTPTQRRALILKRARSRRTFLAFTRRAVLWQRKRGRIAILENPATSRAWRTPEIMEAAMGLDDVVFDQCQVGLKHPTNGKALKKLTQISGPEAVVAPLQGLKCDGSHEHHPIEGGYRTESGRWAALSEYAGGYPKGLCKLLIRGAEDHLAATNGTYVEDDMFPSEDEVPEPVDGDDAIHEEEQLADQDEEFPEDVVEQDASLDDEERRPVSREVKKAVEFVHRQLGHPSRSTMLRMMRLSGSTAEAIRYAKRWTCPVCAAKQKPKHPQASTATSRPYGFNHHIHVDLKFVHDTRDKRYAVLSMICLGTLKHDCVMIKTRRSDYIAQKFFRHWIMPYGPPGKITHDQGGEFEQSFAALLDQMAIPSVVTGAHAPWQLGVGERHGEILGVMLQAIVQEHSVEGFKGMKLAVAAATSAKNSTVTREGYTPHQRVYGTEVKWPSLNDEDVGPSFAEAVNTDSEVARAHQMRTTARIALIRQDVREKLRRAILRKPATSQGPFPSGAQVYFWVPGRGRRYSQTKGSIWRGPGTVLTKELQKRYFISWRGRLLLVAEENLRLATREELALTEPVREEVLDLQGALRDPERSNVFQDLRDIKPPPRRPRRKRKITEGDKAAAPETEERKRARRMMSGTKSVRQLLGRKRVIRPGEHPRRRVVRRRDAPAVKPVDPEMDSEASPSIAPAEEGEERELPAEPKEQLQVPEVVQESEDEEEVPEEPAEAEEEPERTNLRDELEEMELEEQNQQEWQEMSPGARRQRLTDDVPGQIKRKMIEREDEDLAFMPEKKQRVSEGLVTQVVMGTVEPGPDNQWVSRYELTLLRQLTGLPLTAARLHRKPRRKFQRPPKLVGRSRLTIMLGREPAAAFVTEETSAEVQANPRRKASFEWKGMTMFAREDHGQVPRNQRLYPTFLKTEHGMYMVNLDYEERIAFEEAWTQELKDILISEVMVLKLKQSGKELDPRVFSPEEKEKFIQADAREWEQWVDNGVVRRVPKEEEHRIPRHKVFKSPLRMVRVNRTGGTLLPLVAKSRLVVPGHLDPGLGMFRTDAPTTSLTATRLVKAVGAGRGWHAWSFDVTTAFLSGDHTEREIFVKAPPEGLPSVRNQPPVRSLELLQILKSAYGLTEAPRLWYLKASRTLEQTPLREMKAARATFVAAEGGVSWALLALHVDDGLLMGAKDDPRVLKLKEQINQLFKIKEWKEPPFTFLGVDFEKTADGYKDSMASYVKNIQVPDLEKKKGEASKELLKPADLTAFRQLVMRLRWPAQLAMPQMLYSVSSLAQRVSKATYADYQEAVGLHKRFLEEVREGRAELKYPRLQGTPFLVTFFDASLGKEADGKSQLGAIHFLSDTAVEYGPRPAAVVDFQTSKSTRVVRSTMAAESASLSLAADRHVYTRLILDQMLRGVYEVKPTWRTDCQVGGGLVTDARSVYDHMGTTGQVPQERQTMLDLLVAKELLESDVMKMFWVPTHRQYADSLTKKMKDLLWMEFSRRGMVSLKETPQEKILEEHRKELRKGQRQRRKAKFRKANEANPEAAPSG